MRTLRLGMSGTDVMEIQAMLQKIGYYAGPLDGIFGPQTQAAVIRFQRDFGLAPDGIIGPATHAAMERYLLGYNIYFVKSGDTVFSISQRYGISPLLLLAANPGIDADNLAVGQRLIVPYRFNVVDTNIDYTYDVLQRDVAGLRARYPFLEVGSAGKSSLGRDLTYIRLGTGPNQVFYNGAHHSLEWITSPLLMKFIEEFSRAYVLGETMSFGYNPRSIWNASSIYIIPMVNPDGVDLVLNGLSPANPNYNNLIRWNNGSADFSANWQANNNGVDLNHNYNAAWQLSKDAEAAYGVTGPGPTRYSGTAPESEPESRAVADFTRAHDFRLVIAYHTQGRVIYWDFMDMAPPEARIIAQAFSRASGYALDQTEGIASYAGYKDWFIQDFARPGFTIEVGLGVNPLPISQFDTIYAENLQVLLLGAII
ncbi:MAG TPA: M14 family metallopeptidase [Eubacteriales bacterium]|nr:M14 family metallopeptidase [Eubacteriales bacterium]